MLIFFAYLAVYAIMFLFGSVVFSFMNVVIYRLPRGLSPAAGRSHCPRCDHLLGAVDMLPVFGWLLLHGRCRYCGGEISPRYPMVEALGGLLAVALTMRYWITTEMLLCFCVAAAAVAAAFIDWDTMTIPNSLAAAILLLGLAAFFLLPEVSHLSRLAGLLAVSLPLWLITLVIKDAFGGGDIKLMAAAGFFLGFGGVLVAFFAALLLGGGYGAAMLAKKKLSHGQHFAFGPFLAVGIVFSLFCGQEISTWYMGLLF